MEVRSVSNYYNILICKKPDDPKQTHYVFQAPLGIILDAGDRVIRQTHSGISRFVCVTPSFTVTEDQLGPLYGLTPKELKYVTHTIREVEIPGVPQPVED